MNPKEFLGKGLTLSIMCWGKGKPEEPVNNKNVIEATFNQLPSFSNIENSGGKYIELRLEEG